MFIRLDMFAISFFAVSSILIYQTASESIATNSLRSYASVLYVWSGQDASVKNGSDFVAVIDFNVMSTTYGSILRLVRLVSDPIKGIGQAHNEPHHSSISSDGKYYITGGLLSFLSKQKEIFVWKIPRNPKDGPRFVCAIDAPGACTDEFQPIGNSRFLLSMMCDESGGSPGDMVIIDAEKCNATSLLKNRSSFTNFNPHGFGRLYNGSILVGDFVEPITMAGTDPSKIVFRNTVRHISPDGSLTQTFCVPMPTQSGATTGLGQGDGFMEVKTIPNDPLGRGFAGGTNTNRVYLVGPGLQPLSVFDASVVNNNVKVPSAGIMSIFPNGKRMLMTIQMRYVMLMDITNLSSLKMLHTFDFCSDAAIKNILIRVPGTKNTTTFPQFCAKNSNIVGTHVILHPEGENRFIVFNYFLKFGLAQFAGTRTMHAFKFNENLTSFTYDTRFNPNVKLNPSPGQPQTLDSLQAYPHHAQYLKL